tara:strand:- start:173 stop:565 length:393 start_codon:yes stop_codon:yes gene_type:complete
MRFIPAILTLCIAATPAVAFRAENGMIVDQTGPTEFTVASRIGRGPTEYWCAAGDYAIRVLGVPGRTAIYRVTPPPRQGGQDITFSLDPAIGTAETGISRFGSGRLEKGISAAIAQASYCNNFDLIPFFD